MPPLDIELYVTIPLGNKKIFGKGYWLLKKRLCVVLNSQAVNGILTFLISLKKNSFIQLFSEPYILKKMGGDLVSCIIGVYVDDLLITGIKSEINKIIYKIKKKF